MTTGELGIGRNESERMMGLEPTTFCMASSRGISDFPLWSGFPAGALATKFGPIGADSAGICP
jgi:hypothetical protein